MIQYILTAILCSIVAISTTVFFFYETNLKYFYFLIVSKLTPIRKKTCLTMDTREIDRTKVLYLTFLKIGISSWKEHIIAIPKEKMEHRFTNEVL